MVSRFDRKKQHFPIKTKTKKCRLCGEKSKTLSNLNIIGLKMNKPNDSARARKKRIFTRTLVVVVFFPLNNIWINFPSFHRNRNHEVRKCFYVVLSTPTTHEKTKKKKHKKNNKHIIFVRRWDRKESFRIFYEECIALVFVYNSKPKTGKKGWKLVLMCL